MTDAVFMPTMHLRFVERPNATDGETVLVRNILQQAWQNLSTGAIEWRDIPVEVE